MSGPTPGGGVPPPQRPTANGVPPGGMVSQHSQASSAQSGTGSTGSASASNLNSIVIEYLSKKGYNKTEAMLRAESANQEVESSPVIRRAEETGPAMYTRGFELLYNWIEGNLDVYKADLRRFVWPTFVYAFLNIVHDGYGVESRSFFNKFKSLFEEEHPDDIRSLQPLTLPEHVDMSDVGKIYRENKYRVTLSTVAFLNMIQFLEANSKGGGALLISILQTNLDVKTADRAADDQSALAQRISRAKLVEQFPAEDEGIPGHNPGSGNVKSQGSSNVLTKLRLGPMPMEKDLLEDVQAELEEEDAKIPPLPGQETLSHNFDQRIKREESEDVPTRNEMPMPTSTARDVAMEVNKIKEDRDRFKIEGRTGGMGSGVSVVMFTFHNTLDSINCLDFSEDNLLVAAGMRESYIRVWSLDGKAMLASIDLPGKQPSASRRLIGHSGSVYGVSFSPAIASTDPQGPSTNPKYLLSCSEDKTVRLWSLDTWTCLVVYKGHESVVWDVTWSPHGFYFMTGGLDRTARLWRTDQIGYLRLFVGHDKDVDVVGFHPNGVYTFTGSCDKTVRMWQISNGYCVRMFTGHTGNLTSLACSPNGKLLASADDAGTIILWDLASGRLKKRMRGHARAGIWSLSWTVESTVIISGSGDGTVRVWDVDPPADPSAASQGKVVAEGGAGQKIDGNAQMAASASAAAKKKGKDVVVTPDQISAFPTKKSPVYKVKFTRQNLAIAGGAYFP